MEKWRRILFQIVLMCIFLLEDTMFKWKNRETIKGPKKEIH